MEQEKRYIEEDEITLKELILKVQEYFWEVVRNWKWVLLITSPFIIFFTCKAFNAPSLYPAELTFMVNEDNGGGMGGMSAILGQFGFGGGARGKNNFNKILELAKSRRIIHETIFTKVSIDSKEDFVANHLIDIYDFHENWVDDTTGLSNLYFTKDSIELFHVVELKALKQLYRKVVGGENMEGLFKTDYSEDTGIMSLNVFSEKEKLSIELTKIIYSKLSDFYVTKTVEKQQQTFNVMFEKVDSIKKEISKKEYALATFIDSHRSLLNSRDKLTEMRLKRDLQILSEAYGVSLKNFEIADFTLKSKTPFIQVIDVPFAPLKAVNESKIRNLLTGAFIGILLSSLIIIARKIFRDAMQQ